MTISVYSKDGCGKCVAAKDKLNKMGYDYKEYNLEDFTVYHEGWRNDVSVPLMAAYSDMDTLPIISINDDYMNYPSAMKRLKNKHKA